ncbi:MAG: O-antigen ligase family protein [Deferribacteres bacterium]|nr:O-antigen ligase family protein [Deferribacteres bacterium]
MRWIRWWLTGLIFFMPFQRMIVKSVEVWSRQVSFFINRIEEITVAVLLPLAIRELYKNRGIIDRSHIFLSIPFLAIVVSGFISGAVNGSSLIITSLGIFDYIKYFLFIFVYAAFFSDFSDFRKIFRLILILTVCLVIVAFAQELWALHSRYIAGRCIYDKDNYLLGDSIFNIYRDSFREHWRLGIFRTPSLLRSPNFFGFYSLFILTMYFYLRRRVNLFVLFTLMGGIFVSVARMVYAGFLFLTGVQLFRSRRLFMILFIVPFLVILFYMSTLWDFNIWKLTKQSLTAKVESAKVTPYRKYAREKALEVWREYPFWGVGPGRFGGAVSILFKSPLYEKYNFKPEENYLLRKWKSLDQFWPQVLTETGIFGTASFAVMFLTFFMVFLMLGKRLDDYDLKNLFSGLAVFTVIILLWTFGGNIKNGVIFTYSAFAGIGLGCINNKNKS